MIPYNWVLIIKNKEKVPSSPKWLLLVFHHSDRNRTKIINVNKISQKFITPWLIPPTIPSPTNPQTDARPSFLMAVCTLVI